MKKMIVGLMAAVAVAAMAEDFCVIRYDSRRGLVVPRAEESFTFDARWGDGATCAVTVDGQPLNIEGTSGSVEWTPDASVASGKVWTVKFVSGDTVYTRQFATEDMAVALTSNAMMRVEVKSEMVTPKLMKVDYTVKCVSTNVEVRAVAFRAGERSFANVVRVRTATEGTIATRVPSYKPQSFTWNVAADWDVELDKVMVEVLAKPCEILPQDILHLPAHNGMDAMTITCNSVTSEDLFNALLWCYASGDPAITIVDGVVSISGQRVAYGPYICDWDGDIWYSDSSAARAIRDKYPDKCTGISGYFVPGSVTTLLTYLYGKMGYEILSGNKLDYANRILRLSMPSSGIGQTAIKKE